MKLPPHLLITAAAVISTGALACGKTTNEPMPAPVFAWSPSSSPGAMAGLPLELDGVVYNPDTGRILRPLVRTPAREKTWPDVIATEHAPPVTLEKDAAVRKDGDKTIWRTPLKGYVGGVRPPHVVVDQDRNRAVVAADQKLVGLDLDTGSQQWITASGPYDRLFIDGGLVFATDCSSPIGNSFKRWLIARELGDGREAWRVELPREGHPLPINRIADRLLVVPDWGFTWFFTPDGDVTIKLPGEIVFYAEQRADGLLIMTSKRIAMLDASGGQRWEQARPDMRPVGAGGSVSLPNGDVLLYEFGPITDSGVRLTRLRAADGTSIYSAQTDDLGVMHSEYYHAAYVRLRDDKLDIVSIGSSGSFVEVRSADDGKLIKRWEPASKP